MAIGSTVPANERLDRRVALKLLAPGIAADTAFRPEIHPRVTRGGSPSTHPNIIPIYEAGDAAGSLFIAMRYVQGGDVRSLLERGAGRCSAGRAWGIITQVAAALDAAHEYGLVHRDCQAPPTCCSMRAPGLPARQRLPAPTTRPEHVYLSDFGISKQPLSAATSPLTGSSWAPSTTFAPEQIDGA